MGHLLPRLWSEGQPLSAQAMNRLTLKDRLLKWLRTHPGWIPSVELQRIVALNTTYSPQNVGRRLRELENEHLVEVKYERGHAHYRFAGNPVVRQEDWFAELPTPLTH
jgi:DNA-binding transcriptional ArsR family regulator